jgi:uncharacterized membrane protein
MAAVRSEINASPWPERARSVGVLAGVPVSLLLWFAAAAAGNKGRFVAANQLDLPLRSVLTVAVVAVPTLVGAGLLAVAWRRSDLWPKLSVWSERLCPALLLCLIPGLFSRRLWKDHDLALLFAIAFVSLVAERLLRIAFVAWADVASRLWAKVKGWLPQVIARGPTVLTWCARATLAAGVSYYAIRVSELTILNHVRMATLSSDLAEFDNLFYNALHGHPFRSPAIEGDLADFSALKVHAEFVLYLLLPLYALSPGPEALLIVQSAFVAATAVPLYLLAARRLGEPTAAVFALSYLLLPAVERPNFYDFHFVPVGMFFVAWTLYFVDRHVLAKDRPGRRDVTAAIGIGLALPLALLSREDIAFGMAILGLVVLVGGKAPKLGAAIFAASTLWFVVVKFVVMPRFGTMWFSDIYETLKAPGRRGYFAIVQTLLTNPAFVMKHLLSEEKLLFMMHLLVPLAFLWVRRWWLLVAALPGLPFTVLVTDRPPLFQTSFQYVYHWIPYVFAAAVLGLESIGPRGSARRLAASVALLLASLGASYHFGAFLGTKSIVGGFSEKRFTITSGERARFDRLQEVVRTIPTEASVAATEAEGPHVSTRLLMFSLKFSYGRNPDYVLLGPHPNDGEVRHLADLLKVSAYSIARTSGEFMLLERGQSGKSLDQLAPALSRRLRLAK